MTHNRIRPYYDAQRPLLSLEKPNPDPEPRWRVRGRIILCLLIVGALLVPAFQGDRDAFKILAALVLIGVCWYLERCINNKRRSGLRGQPYGGGPKIDY